MLSLIPRPDLLEKGPGIHCLHMRIIIYAKTEGEGHMTFPIHMLDDVMYCTRTKLQRELYCPDSLSSLQSITNYIMS